MKKVTKLLSLTENPLQGNFEELIDPAEDLQTAVKNLTTEGLKTCKASDDEARVLNIDYTGLGRLKPLSLYIITMSFCFILDIPKGNDVSL